MAVISKCALLQEAWPQAFTMIVITDTVHAVDVNAVLR